jgi:hypothetical protein
LAKSTGIEVADRVADFIGKSLGELMNRKDALQTELARVDAEMLSVRDSVMRQFGDAIPQARKVARKAARQAKRAFSPETRAKMADAAKRRWAKAKRAGKNSLG